MVYKFRLHITEPLNTQIHTPGLSKKVFLTRKNAEVAAKEAIDTLNRWLEPSMYLRDFKAQAEIVEISEDQSA